jgi:hypothetical protein
MANGAVSAMILKVSCESLGIKNSAIMDEEMKKKDGIIDAFVSGVGPKKIGTNAGTEAHSHFCSTRARDR